MSNAPLLLEKRDDRIAGEDSDKPERHQGDAEKYRHQDRQSIKKE